MEENRPKLSVTKIPKLNTLVIKQRGGNFFIASQDAIVIEIGMLSQLLKFMLNNGILSHKVLEGVLEEYHSYGKDLVNEKNVQGS